MSGCTRCGGIAGDLYLCGTCALGLKIELTDVPDLLAHLDITRSRQDQLTAPYDHGTAGGEIPLPYKVHVAEVVWVLHDTLYVWARVLDHTVDESTTTAGLARWLLRRLDLVRIHSDADQLVDEITNAVHQARRAIDRPNDQRLFLGPCGNNGCTEEIFGLAWHRIATCPLCAAEYDIERRQAWLHEVAQGHLGTATEIAGFLRTTGVQCTHSMIRNYAARGRLTPAGVDARDHQLFRIEDVLFAIQNRYSRRSAS